MRHVKVPIILVALVVVPCVVVFALIQTRGVRVTITNNGPHALTDIVAHVTGNKHPVGDLAVGKSRTVRVLPISESHLELTFRDHLGRHHEINAGGYFENAYHGTIEVEITNGKLDRNRHDIRVSWIP